MAREGGPWRRAATMGILASILASTAPVGGQDAKSEGQQPKRGAFQVTFTERSPLSTLAVLQSRATIMKKNVGDYDLSKETLEAYVPASYSSSPPYGLVVFVSSSDRGECPSNYRPIMDRRRLIWIGANKSGNERKPTNVRLGFALDAVHNMSRQYAIDPERIYVSGISGGGSQAAMLMFYFPDVFTGGFPLCAPGPSWDGAEVDFYIVLNKPKPPQWALVQTRSRFAILSGGKDFNRSANQEAAAILKRDKANATYLESPGAGHDLSPPDLVDQAIAFLDKPLADKAKKTYEKAVSQEKNKQLDQALEGYGQAAAHGGDQDFVANAAEKAKELAGQYDSSVREIEQTIEGGKLDEGRKKINDLKRIWPKRSAAGLKRLEQLLADARRKKSGSP